jgi:hypothetical protein
MVRKDRFASSQDNLYKCKDNLSTFRLFRFLQIKKVFAESEILWPNFFQNKLTFSIVFPNRGLSKVYVYIIFESSSLNSNIISYLY